MIVRACALSAEAFAPFGDVIAIEGRESRWINDNTCRRFDDLAHIDVAQDGGRPVLSVFEANPRALPLQVRLLERHPLSSQAFIPLGSRPFLTVVAEDGPSAQAGILRAYMSSGRQGVNYRRNTWHHPLIALGEISRFLVVDRGGPGENYQELALDAVVLVTS
ncbi:MAG: ureidoglycolate lyase [Steroidobacteraceae bacterium]